MCVQVCRTIDLNADFKVKFLVLKHQALNTKGNILVLKKSFEDLEDDMKKGQQKVEPLIRRCIKP
jgi:hypothetical protein